MSFIISSFHIVEEISSNGIDSSDLFFLSYCGKAPFDPGVKKKSILFFVYGILAIICLVLEMGCHIIVLFKQTRIETRASVYILKDNRVVSNQRHNRNIVSTLGHFASFMISMAQLFLLFYSLYFFVEDEEIMSKMRTLTMFLSPATEFLLYPLIETIFSERLRSTFPILNIVA